MEKGYSFLWKAGMPPVLYTPTKKVVPPRVKNNIPSLEARDWESMPRDRIEMETLPVAAMVHEGECGEDESDDEGDRTKR